MVDRATITRARDDLAEFARIVGRPLTAAQVAALGLERRVTVLIGSRQSGKSRSQAVLALHRAFRAAGVRVLIISAGDDAAKRLLGEVRAIAVGSPLLAGSVVDEQAALVRLSNGSTIRSVPASERAVRGHSVDLLLIDEAALVEDDLILGAALPTTAARPDARIVLASSPLGARGAFYDYAQRGINGSANVATHRLTIADSPWMTDDSLAALREGLSDLRAAAELDGEFVDLDGGERLIDSSWIRAAQQRVLPLQRSGVAGLDVARFGGDSSTLYVNRGGVVRRLFSVRKRDTTEVAALTAGTMRAQLEAPPENVVVAVDDAGVGGGVTDQLRRSLLSVVAFVGAERARKPERFANRRAETYWLLREAFRDGLIDLDARDRELALQLGELRYGYDDRARLLIESKTAMGRRGVSSPDCADACAMTMAQQLWRPVEPPSAADEARALRARIDAAYAAKAWSEPPYETWIAEYDRERPLPAGLDF